MPFEFVKSNGFKKRNTQCKIKTISLKLEALGFSTIFGMQASRMGVFKILLHLDPSDPMDLNVLEQIFLLKIF